MIERTTGLILAALGALVALGCLLVRLDVERMAQTGPRWRRRLLAVGLAVLTASGIISCGTKAPTPSPAVETMDTAMVKVAPTTPAQRRERDPRWHRYQNIRDTLKHYSGLTTIRPDERDRILPMVPLACADLAALGATGLISKGEVDRYTGELAILQAEVAILPVSTEPGPRRWPPPNGNMSGR